MVDKDKFQEVMADIDLESTQWPNLPNAGWRNAGKLRKEIVIDSLPRQYTGRSIRKKPSYVIVDDYCSSGKSPEIDPQELRNAIGRTLRGEAPDASPFRARIQSQKQLKKRYWKNVKRMLEAERKEGEQRAKRCRAEKHLGELVHENAELHAQIADLKTIIEQLEDKKLPEKGSW